MTTPVNSTTPTTIPCRTQEASTLNALSHLLSALINKVVRIWTACTDFFYSSRNTGTLNIDQAVHRNSLDKALKKPTSESSRMSGRNTGTLTIDKAMHRDILDRALRESISESSNMTGRDYFIKDLIARCKDKLDKDHEAMSFLFNNDQKTLDFTKKSHISLSNPNAGEKLSNNFFTKFEDWLSDECGIPKGRERRIISDLIYLHLSQHGIGNLVTPIFKNFKITPKNDCEIHHLAYNIKVTNDLAKKITIHITSIVQTSLGFIDADQEEKMKNQEPTHYLLPHSSHELILNLTEENGQLSLSTESETISYKIESVSSKET